ncbi:hypothetical protein GQ457_11G007750 [Hibiscus cannabinus]
MRMIVVYSVIRDSSYRMLERSLSDTQLLLWWDLEMDEIVVPLRRCPPAGSLTYSTGANRMQPAPNIRDVPKISPLVALCFHTKSLSGLIFTPREGHIKSLDETRCCRKPTEQQ